MTQSIAQWLEGWDPGTNVVADSMDTGPLEALSAALDLPAPTGDSIPPLWHFLYFLQWPPSGELGPDGHPLRSELLPPLPERTRMFGGGRVTFASPLRCGIEARRRSTIGRWEVKEARSGPILLVTERHEVEQEGSVVLVEEHDLVYRSGPVAQRSFRPLSTSTPVVDAPWSVRLDTGPVLLFRMSALTANSHRIHYDQPYATSVEGYPGLVVHGPLLAIAMANLAGGSSPGRKITSLAFRLHRPAFAGEVLVVAGWPREGAAELSVMGEDGEARATAQVTFA